MKRSIDMRKHIIAGGLVAIAGALGCMPRIAAAEIKCKSVAVTEAGTKTVGSVKLTRLRSEDGFDHVIGNMCQPDWTHADDYWRYGEYYPLHDGPTHQREGADKFVKTRPRPPAMQRYVCGDAGADGNTPYAPTRIVGAFAYEQASTNTPGDTPGGIVKDVQLHVLCVPPERRGEQDAQHRPANWGIQTLNAAVRHATASLLSDQQRIRFRLLSHAKATGFYERLDMSCTEDTASDGQPAKTFSRTLAKNEAIARRKAIYYDDYRGDCHRVHFGCADREVYLSLLHRANEGEDGLVDEQNAENHSCGSGSPLIEVKAVLEALRKAH
ncbi:MAG: hypothetical protein ACTHJZ_01940 [Trinickia sp.]|uniref:hypothetical protein n=1 Tax=Trinickia sp. TaxID=2571163 RepID=UPI003F81B4FA